MLSRQAQTSAVRTLPVSSSLARSAVPARGLTTATSAHARNANNTMENLKRAMTAINAKSLVNRRAFSSVPADTSRWNEVDTIKGQHYKPGVLEFDDGTKLTGYSFGEWKSVAGEVVFNTGMVGYTESLTDPSYEGQILVMTYPMIGNYGVPGEDVDEWGLLKYYESNRIHVRGLIVSDYCEEYSHWEATQSLATWLKKHKIPALFGVDTRALTKKIRDHNKGSKTGTALNGRIIADTSIDFEDTNGLNLVEAVSTKTVKTYNPNGKLKILLLDVGVKYSIIRRLLDRGVSVTVVPWDHDVAKELGSNKYDGMLISNGPGDPAVPTKTLDNIKKAIALPNPKPIYGICLGHQLMSLAAGASTYKMRFGHRGHNQPCIDITDQRCYITSQNHGFAVDNSSFQSESWETYFLNANDQTSEGIAHKQRPFFTTQFHPEGAGGPEDTGFLFDRFIQLVKDQKDTGVIKSINLKKLQPIPINAKQNVMSLGQSLVADQPMKSLITTSPLQHAVPVEPHTPRSADPASVKFPWLTEKGVPNGAPALPTKVLVLGSGGLQIGQAGEFDYSGSQAIKALKEENISSILINPNIATVQTAKGLADKVYFSPLTPDFVEAVIEKEKPDAIFLQFGGQTALNCGIALDQSGVLKKHNVRVLGTSVQTIIATEDRDIFKEKLVEINEPIAVSVAANTVDEAIKAANEIGYPVIARAAFSLGGLGSGFANNDVEMKTLCQKAFAASPQVLIERSMRGWKEVEYEVVRDSFDNCVTVCNMENFDPLGIHTGDSIVIAPSQTLNDAEYHLLRRAAIRIVRHLGIIGECNVQYALHPTSRRYCVIEVNPRLSRSSALASKATGYPLAFVAAKIALGKSLTQIKNSITQITAACFEPSLDYCVVKVPRWDLKKFFNANPVLGSGMKSVGEVMAIGRNFEEAFQKALRMVDGGAGVVQGFHVNPKFPSTLADDKLNHLLDYGTDQRVWALAEAFKRGYSVDRIWEITKIDKWYLHKLARIFKTSALIQSKAISGAFTKAADVPAPLLKFAKQIGFTDEQLARELNVKGAKHTKPVKSLDVRLVRLSHGIAPVTKQIDTLAAEFAAKTNYLYSTYNGDQNDLDYNYISKKNNGVMVLGAGCYCIGNSVEFDYTAVSTLRALRKMGKPTIMMNYNPETVSTDYDESDRLYFDELSLERVLDVCEAETPEGVVVSVGGQIPNNLVNKLHEAGIRILGTHPNQIDQAEDRNKFSALMDQIGVNQPKWANLTSTSEAQKFASEVGYPVLVRPSYVLSGAAMKVVRDEKDLNDMLHNAKEVSREFPVVISKFIENAMEVDFDGVAQNGKLLVHAISEHVEQAGTHSGDATLFLPAQSLSAKQTETILNAGRAVGKALNINGPYNAQFIVKGDDIRIIETNVRASRSMPFVSKVLDVDFIDLATKIMVGGTYADLGGGNKIVNPPFKVNDDDVNVELSRLNFVACKVPQFSYGRLGGADPVCGVEMTSTGEVACYGKSKEEAFLKAYLASNMKLPRKRVLVVTHEEKFLDSFLPHIKLLKSMGYEISVVSHMSETLSKSGINHKTFTLEKGTTDHHTNSVFDLLGRKGVDFVFSFGGVPASKPDELAYLIRRRSVDFSLPICTNLQVGQLLVEALNKVQTISIQGSDEFVHSIKP